MVELARKISVEYGDFFETLMYKQLADYATIFDTEKELIFELLKKCNLYSMNENELDVDMNSLLIEYLVENYNQNDEFYINLEKKFPQVKKQFEYRRVYKEIMDLGSAEQIINQYKDLFEPEIQHEFKELSDEKKWEKLIKQYRPLTEVLYPFKSSILVMNIYSLFDAYDFLLQENMDEESYSGFILYLDNYGAYEDFELEYYRFLRNKYLPYIKEEIKNGRKIEDLVDEFTKKYLAFDIMANKICEQINDQNFFEKIEELANIANKFENECPLFVGFYATYCYIRSNIGKYFQNKGFEEVNFVSKKIDGLFRKYFKNYKFFKELFFTADSIAICGIAKNLKRLKEDDNGEFALDFIKWMDTNKCDLGRARSDTNYDKLVYFLYLSYNNMPEEKKDEFGKYFFNLYSKELFQFVDTRDITCASDEIIYFENDYVSLMFEDLVSRLIEIAKNDKERAIEFLRSVPSIWKIPDLCEELEDIGIKKSSKSGRKTGIKPQALAKAAFSKKITTIDYASEILKIAVSNPEKVEEEGLNQTDGTN